MFKGLEEITLERRHWDSMTLSRHSLRCSRERTPQILTLMLHEQR